MARISVATVADEMEYDALPDEVRRIIEQPDSADDEARRRALPPETIALADRVLAARLFWGVRLPVFDDRDDDDLSDLDEEPRFVGRHPGGWEWDADDFVRVTGAGMVGGEQVEREARWGRKQEVAQLTPAPEVPDAA